MSGPHDQAELPAELVQLDAIAAATDAAVDQAAQPPGAPGQAPEVDPVAGVADMLKLTVQVLGKLSDLVPKYYPPETCDAIAAAYVQCADKHGWTWHTVASPELSLAAAAGVPALLLTIEAKQRRDQAAAQAEESRRRATAGQRLG